MTSLPFIKMHGIGNDFVMFDGFSGTYPDEFWSDLAVRLCHRRFGVGADGLILASAGNQAEFRMRMWNPDGSESEMCGNGLRCFAKRPQALGRTRASKVAIETGAGPLEVELLADGGVRVDMGPARFLRGEIGMTGDPNAESLQLPVDTGRGVLAGAAVSMGNPHVVLPVERLDDWRPALSEVGPLLEHHSEFPNRTNVHFVQVLSRTHAQMITWERGAGATLACGTGACATASALHRLGLADSDIELDLPGGRLRIEWNPDRVFMTGPAEFVFEGSVPIE
ncbi:MAG: diaminopimelate epimerase [Fimbriimonadaceae bacterium]|nr:diaminopimelate epimerase [Fimbriimonadaceae bacterium]